MTKHHPHTGHYRTLKFLARGTSLFLLILALLLLVAHLGLTYHEEFQSFRRLMYHNRGYLLAWRCLLYAAVYGGIVWLWKRSVRQHLPVKPVCRLAGAFTVLIAVNELAVWSGEAPL